MPTLLADIRYGIRLLARNPGFAAIAILALALGVGANTAIFSLVDRVLIRPLPYTAPDRLVVVWEDASDISFPHNTPAPANYVDWKKQNQVFTDMAATRGRVASLTGDGPPDMIFGRAVTANLFDVLGVKPRLGRTFTEEEDRNGVPVVIIGYGLWQSRYGGDPAIVGRGILMDGIKTTVIGVMSPDFNFPGRKVQYWAPIHFTPRDLNNRGSHYLIVYARLKPGIGLARAQSDMSAIARRLSQAYPRSNQHTGAVVVPLKDEVVGNTGTALLVLLAAAGCVLLIACANVANLLLSKAAAREREMAIRTALGAARMRLIRQMATESVLLALTGGLLGLVAARLAMRVLAALIPAGVAGPADLSIDGRLLAFNLAVSVLTGLAFGLAPAFHATALAISEKLKEGGRGGVGGSSRRFRDALVVTEVALAMILLVSAGLLLETLRNLHAIDAGFSADKILTLTTRLPFPKYADATKRMNYFDRVLERVRALPGVESAAFTSNLPFTARGNTNGFRIEGRQFPVGTNPDALYREVTNDYLQTMRVRLLEGRFFSSEDRAGSPLVLIINETFKKQYWPNESPLGKRIQIDGPWTSIIGVVADIRERGLEEELKPGVYLPVSQVPNGWNVPSQLALRTANDPHALAKAARDAIWSVDRDQAISEVQTMNDIVDQEVSGHRQQTVLLGSFAALALVLASLGIYGVLSYAVSQRTREIGVRMALGASTGDVTRMVVRQGAALAALGIGIGIGVALVATRVLTKLLVGVAPTNPAIYAGVAILLAAVALAACYIPAARASSVDPMVALRDE